MSNMQRRRESEQINGLLKREALAVVGNDSQGERSDYRESSLR
jgi:hypothetical protein